MADKKIQIKHKNGETWDLLFPVTKASFIIRTNDKDIETSITEIETNISGIQTNLTNKADKKTVYTKTETDQKITAIKKTPIPVQKTPPVDSDLWFEELV